MVLPDCFSGNMGIADEQSKAPWTMLSAGPSSTAFHKMLAELALNTQHFKPDQVIKSGCCPPVSRMSDRYLNPITYAGDTWIQQVHGGIPAGHYNGTSSTELGDSSRHYPEQITFNGGSLILDTARGELVNASRMTPKEILEAKALAASRSHSEAERRRRKRINSHLATLRTLLPSSTKTDKASLLAEVIDQVRILKRQVSEIYELGSMPTDIDELMVEKEVACGDGKLLFKASLCCDDRPDLISDLIKALDTLGLRTLKAEISTLGGRVKNVFFMTLKDDAVRDSEQGGGPSVNCVQEALRQVMERSAGCEMTVTSNKKQRLAAGCAAI